MPCDRCAELEEKIRQLESELYGQEWAPPPGLVLTRCELAIVRALLAGDRVVPDWTLFLATRAALGRYSDMDGTVVKVWMSKIRSKFTPLGLTIETVWGTGYRITGYTRRRLLNPTSQQTEAA
jgi:DNA-binding response OmpR family regulator